METQAAGHRRLLTKVTAASWTDLKTLCEAGGNEVTLTDSFVASSYTEQINFSGKACVVIGNGTTVDAGNRGRFFYGSGAGSSLEVHGLVLKNGYASTGNGYASTGGGAVYAVGGANVEIYTCTFESNIAQYNAGAIYIEDGTLVVHDSTFHTNSATNGKRCGSCASAAPTCSSSSDCSGGQTCYFCGLWGGAIYASESGLEIHDTSFVSNRCGAHGGAIYILGGTLVVHDSTFDTNTAESVGAAICVQGSSAKVEIYTCTFESNTATYVSE
jgi:predicted outer membrane repeat protein